MTNTRTSQQVNDWFANNNIQQGGNEAESMAIINAAGLGNQWTNFASDAPKDIEAQIDDEIAKRKAAIPDYGSLAQPSYKAFTPYSGSVPEFTPFSEKLFKESPDYQFRLDEGNKAIDRASSARGNFYSGKALKDATDFSSNLASNEYNSARNNYNQDYSTNYGRFVDARNNYNQDFSTAYNQADRNDSTLFNRLSSLGGTGAINTGINANNSYLNNQNSVFGATANVAGAAGVENNNNINRTIGNLSSRFGSF